MNSKGVLLIRLDNFGMARKLSIVAVTAKI
jgi:hypothetical protein